MDDGGERIDTEQALHEDHADHSSYEGVEVHWKKRNLGMFVKVFGLT